MSTKAMASDRRYICDECPFDTRFKYLPFLFGHWAQRHKHLDIFGYCEECDRELQTYNGFRQHLHASHMHVGETAQGSNDEHLLVVSRQLHCNHCSKWFTQKHNLTVHVRAHISTCVTKQCIIDSMRRDTKFRCDSCNRSFADRQRLEHHVNSDHTNRRLFVCDMQPSVCRREFVQKANMMRHVRTAHQRNAAAADRRQCAQCDKWFSCARNLSLHARTHEQSWTYVCDVCDLGFNQSTTLRTHINHRHVDGARLRFGCEYCSVSFAHRFGLYYHQIVRHTEPL